MLEQQNDRCAICITDLKSEQRRHIDHDHNAGHVRAILCPACNYGLGKIETHLAAGTLLQHVNRPTPLPVTMVERLMLEYLCLHDRRFTHAENELMRQQISQHQHLLAKLRRTKPDCDATIAKYLDKQPTKPNIVPGETPEETGSWPKAEDEQASDAA